MTMSDTMITISLIAGFGISLASMGLLWSALAPAWVGRCEERFRTAPGRTLAAGLVLGGLPFVASLALLNAPAAGAKFAGLALLLSLVAVALAGAAGLARHLGRRLPSPADADRPWKAVIRGWAVLYLAALLPILGWFVLLPLALLSGVGAAVLSAVRPATAPAAAPVPAAKGEVAA